METLFLSKSMPHCRGDTDGREGDTDDGISEDDYTFAK